MKKILIVDDEPHVIMVLKQFLERSGYTICSAVNGKLALESITEEKPDVVITDVQMPIMNGIQLCTIIKQQRPELMKLIILMTSRTDRCIREWADQYDNVILMEKPLSMRHLVVCLNDYFLATE